MTDTTTDQAVLIVTCDAPGLATEDVAYLSLTIRKALAAIGWDDLKVDVDTAEPAL